MNAKYKDHIIPISIKGILGRDGKYLLRKNEREEWELLGGKLEPGEQPMECLVREFEEEAGVKVNVGKLIDAWVYHITETIDVLVMIYLCLPQSSLKTIQSPEQLELGWFSLSEIENLRMPENYKISIRAIK